MLFNISKNNVFFMTKKRVRNNSVGSDAHAANLCSSVKVK